MNNKGNYKDQYERHYDREERLAMMPEALIKLKSRKKGFFRNNKSMMIILADIIIICLLALGFMIYTRISSNSHSTQTHTFVLNGYVLNNRALISLRITRKRDHLAARTPPRPFEATINISGNNDYYKKVFDFLPEDPDRDVIFRAVIPVEDFYTSQKHAVTSTVQFDNTTINLKYNLKTEN